MTEAKTKTTEIRLPDRTALALEQIAELAGTSEESVVQVMLALYAGAWIGGEDRREPVE